ncbi:hypothetical protein HHI36_004858, partial [Cryptolaemus montrouzieri]
MCSPISDLLKGRKKELPISWTPEVDVAFHNMKKALTSTPILASPDISKLFSIMCDASDTGVAQFSFKKKICLEHHVAYF